MPRLIILILCSILMTSCTSVPQVPKSCDGFTKRPINPEMQPQKTSKTATDEGYPSC